MHEKDSKRNFSHSKELVVNYQAIYNVHNCFFPKLSYCRSDDASVTLCLTPLA